MSIFPSTQISSARHGVLLCLFAALIGLLSVGCDGADPSASSTLTPPAVHPTLGELSWVVPGVGLPDAVTLQDSNNNLDVIRHDGRVFFAFRTSETHFAGPSTILWVLSSDDEVSWRYEGHFAMGTDLREPRFLSWRGELWLYFAVLGQDPAKFEPQGTKVTRYLGLEQWSAPKDTLDDTFIPWRIHVLNDQPLMVGYSGGGNIYDADGNALLQIKLLTTDDGETWRPWVKGTDGTVLTSGGSETDVAVLPDGALVAVVRNEAGDDSGFGSKICRAEAGKWDQWTCAADPKKYDSPQLFMQGGQVWLLGRRSLANEGRYDLGDPDDSPNATSTKYQLQWWGSPKRCALWRVDPQALEVTWALDLPSKGDTCFPTALPLPNQSDTWRVYNYTSPLEGDDMTWLQGQLGQTRIYRIDVSFSP